MEPWAQKVYIPSHLVAAGLGKSRQVGDDGKSWIPGYWQLA